MVIWASWLVAILLGWGGYRAYLASKNLVTLNVRDADVRDVIRKCEWQTWETIVVNKDVKGKVTLNVRKVPLEEVLGIIGDQTSSRATAVYPIFSKSKSIVNLRKLARGDIDRETAGWTNFVMRGGGGRGDRGGGPGFGGRGGGGGFGGFGDIARSQNSLVSLNVPARDLGFAALALSRFSQAQVVPEDGATAIITLRLAQVPFDEAVARVAKQAHRKWDVFYSLQSQPDFFADRGEGERGPRRGDGEGRGRRGDGDTNRWAEFRESRSTEREREEEARLATMTPEEQAKAKEDQQKMEEIRNLPPEQQREQFERMANDSGMRQRMENRGNSAFKNATPDQRVDTARRRAEMRQRREKQTQQGK